MSFEFTVLSDDRFIEILGSSELSVGDRVLSGGCG